MMSIDTIDKINDLLHTRRSHLERLKQACGKTGMGVTLHGRYQGDDFVAAIRPHVVALIRNQISHVDWDLRNIGVEPDPIPEKLTPDYTFALKSKVVGYSHTMHKDGGEVEVVLSHSELPNFGIPGVDYDSSYTVVTVPLYEVDSGAESVK